MPINRPNRRMFLPSAAALTFAMMMIGATPAAVLAQAQEDAPAQLKLAFEIHDESSSSDSAATTYEMIVSANGDAGQLRVGTEVPVPVTSFASEDGGSQTPVTSFKYRNVGTNISVTARGRAGAFEISFHIEQSSLRTPRTDTASGLPEFRTLSYHHDVMLADGQEATLAAVGAGAGSPRLVRVRVEQLR